MQLQLNLLIHLKTSTPIPSFFFFFFNFYSYLYKWLEVLFDEVVASFGSEQPHKPGGTVVAVLSHSKESTKRENNQLLNTVQTEAASKHAIAALKTTTFLI